MRSNEPRRPGVLLTSPGSKFRLVRELVRVASVRGIPVFGCDFDSLAETRHLFDGFSTVPASDTPEFKDAIFTFCRDNNVGLLIPTRDGDMGPLSDLNARLRELGTRVMLPKSEVVRFCQDKREFSQFLDVNGYASIPVVSDVCLTDMPYFARPYFGSGSRGCGVVDSLEEAKEILTQGQKMLHPFLRHPEYSVDLLSDINGEPIQAVARKRRRVVNGESVLTTVQSIPKLEEQTIELGRKLGLKGHSVFQAFIDQGGHPIFIEVNLRFGGASCLSIKAGLRSPERILDMAFGTSSVSAAAKAVWPIEDGLTYEQTPEGDDYYFEEPSQQDVVTPRIGLSR